MPKKQSNRELDNRRRFVLTAVIVALSLLGDALLYALLPSRPEAFGLRIWQIGILLGANRFVRLLTNELAGRLVQRSHSNRPLYGAIVLGSLITASYALPIGFWGLLAARLAWGACWSLLRVEGYLAALNVSTKRTRGRIFAVYQAITRIGQGGGVLIGGFLTDTIGIVPTFFIFGLGTLSGVILLSKTPKRPQPSPFASSRHSEEQSPISPVYVPDTVTDPPEPVLKKVRSSLPILFASLAPLWGCALTLPLTEQMVANLTGRLVAERIAPILPTSLGITSLTGLLLGFRFFGALILSPLTGLAGDRIGRRSLLGILILLQACFIAGIAFFRTWPLLVVCLLLQFAAGNAVYLLIYTLAGDLALHSDRALHMSRFSTFLDLGTSLGPIIGFAIYSRHGFVWVAVLAWLLIATAFILLRRLSALSHEEVY
ncbi:MAG: MFS transporter [Spirochaetaceae bacterium]|nr:MAG: MFS transporter [Spirochaetaceae bacterium]